MVASTPCGKHEEFYKWCTQSSKSYKPNEQDIKNFEFNGYEVTTSLQTREEKGNGWTEIYSPSVVNKELLKINPITEQTYLQDIKDQLSELRYDQEVMAEFGDEEMGVYQKKFIHAAVKSGAESKHRYVDINDTDAIAEILRDRTGPIVLGVDWDAVQAGTTFVCVQLDKNFKNQNGIIEPKFKILFRTEIARGQFTYTNAVNKIIELNDAFDFDWIAVDKGYGYTQIELLHKYGLENPETGLHDKVVGYQLGEKIEVRDPHTHTLDRKPLKPFMVNNSVIAFEKEKIVFDPTDKIIIEQFESYRIKSISITGLPSYSDDNEHAVDAVNLCLLIIEQKYGSLFKNIINSKIVSINEINRGEERVNLRSMDKPKEKSVAALIGVIGQKSGNQSLSRSISQQSNYVSRAGFGRSNTFSRGKF